MIQKHAAGFSGPRRRPGTMAWFLVRRSTDTCRIVSRSLAASGCSGRLSSKIFDMQILDGVLPGDYHEFCISDVRRGGRVSELLACDVSQEATLCPCTSYGRRLVFPSLRACFTRLCWSQSQQ
jgi:hypothetical protein